MQNFAPIALFVYNRPGHTRRTVKFLKENKLAEESRLFVFSDGPKNAADRDKVAEVREFIKDISGFRSVEIIEHEQNLGLADSIINGVTRLVNEYGKVIVFEDDLLSSPYTLQYFNEALQRYEHEEKVMHIGAYMYLLKDQNLPEAFFLRITTSWGWATWKRAWDFFERDIDKLTAQFDEKKINAFSIEKTMNFWKQMKEFKAGKNNSWAIRWYASIFLRNGLALNPSKSLINNIGGLYPDIYKANINSDPVSQFPKEIQENKQAYEAVKNFHKKQKGNFWQQILRFVKGKFKQLPH